MVQQTIGRRAALRKPNDRDRGNAMLFKGGRQVGSRWRRFPGSPGSPTALWAIMISLTLILLLVGRNGLVFFSLELGWAQTGKLPSKLPKLRPLEKKNSPWGMLWGRASPERTLQGPDPSSKGSKF